MASTIAHGVSISLDMISLKINFKPRFSIIYKDLKNDL